MKKPGSDHPMAVTAHPKRVRIVVDGVTIADTTNALCLIEAGYEPVLYVPREDADWGFLRANARRTICPYKGKAGYFDLVVGDVSRTAAVWSYEDPDPTVARIKGHLSFYKDKVVIDER